MIWIVLIAIASCVIFIVYQSYPRTIDVTLTGVRYQLGAKGAKVEEEPATVVIKGKLHAKLKGQRTFRGEVTIVGEQIPVPADQRQVEIRFAEEGWGAIAYPYFIYDERGAVSGSNIYNSHLLFANKDFSQVSLLLAEQVPESKDGLSAHTLWDAEHGWVLSAPAATREEGLAISNVLMREYLKTYGELE
ncbi:hypothetical protein BCM02_107308 [Paenibacillus methanolicus]|uniref:Uncharacterized protein n=2 Tax=Paenibacillus methanolicus TaxID=582686 RepID=A0A5S5C1Z3_9BACL|nr:hypothetical protein BCM02_107308 [Paenibacillus methanolicus]